MEVQPHNLGLVDQELLAKQQQILDEEVERQENIVYVLSKAIQRAVAKRDIDRANALHQHLCIIRPMLRQSRRWRDSEAFDTTEDVHEVEV